MAVYTGFARETITVSTAVKQLTSTTYQPSSGDAAREAFVFIRSGGPINWTFDGTAPTSTSGSGPWLSEDSFIITGLSNIAAFKAILDTSASGDATLEIEYLR